MSVFIFQKTGKLQLSIKKITCLLPSPPPAGPPPWAWTPGCACAACPGRRGSLQIIMGNKKTVIGLKKILPIIVVKSRRESHIHLQEDDGDTHFCRVKVCAGRPARKTIDHGIEISIRQFSLAYLPNSDMNPIISPFAAFLLRSDSDWGSSCFAIFPSSAAVAAQHTQRSIHFPTCQDIRTPYNASAADQRETAPRALVVFACTQYTITSTELRLER